MRRLVLGLAAAVMADGAQAAPRVVSLDQCADQYVLALSPREAIVGLSPRAVAPDSYLRDKAAGLPRIRATAEDVLAARPTVVVRSWGGSPALDAALARRGVRTLKIEEAAGFDDVRANVRRVAAGLDARAAGEAIFAGMDAKLAGGRGAWRGAKGLYLTSALFSAGHGTLIDAMLRAAGIDPVVPRSGYAAVSLERLTLSPPSLLVLGFFEGTSLSRWAPGRTASFQRLAAHSRRVTLPATILGCPAWFAADGVEALAKAAPR